MPTEPAALPEAAPRHDPKPRDRAAKRQTAAGSGAYAAVAGRPNDAGAGQGGAVAGGAGTAAVDVQGFAAAMGIEVRDERWYRQAFSHASYVNERGDPGASSNERLEFLGDAVVNLVAGRYFFEQYPDLPEGDLSRLRAAVVRATTLANRAKELDLGRFAVLGKGEELAGGRQRPGFLADLFEAVVGAIFLDAGLGAASEFVLTHLHEDLLGAAGGERQVNFKAQLLEAVQRRGNGGIGYEVVSAEGPDHEKRWTSEVRVNGLRCGVGTARSKRQAEGEAARQALLLGWGEGLAGR